MSVVTLKHITDFACLDEADVPGLVAHFPGVIDFIRGQVSALTPGQAGADVVESIIIQTSTPHGLVMQIPGSSSPVTVSPTHAPGYMERCATYKLGHISDLGRIHAEDVPAFLADIPTLVATMKQLQVHCAAEGLVPSEVFPYVTFEPALGDKVVLRNDNSTREVSGEDMRDSVSRRHRMH